MRVPGYAVQRTIGKGGMATVYLAIQQSLNRPVALKTLRVRPIDLDDPEQTVYDEDLSQTERFMLEGRIVAGLQHTHIVQIYDIGATEDALYISMEYVGGGDLQARLTQPLPPRAALKIVSQIGSALEAAHRKGVVHRDVKPANILFRDDGTPLLSDFGIAKDLEAESELTSTGRVLGSPFYMSPEQAENVTLDGRADLYSLGVILYEMVVGKRPYDGTSAVKVVVQHLQAPVPTLPAPLEDLQPLLTGLMAKNRDARFEDAAEVVAYADALREELDRGSTVSSSASYSLRSDALRGTVSAEVVQGFRNGILEDLNSDRLVLPSLPDVVMSVRRELSSPDATGASIARVIATDPALSAQVLRVANSAFYFGQAPVRDLQRAVVRLGNNTVQQVVMMLVVAQLYDVGARKALKPQLTRLWRHSTLVASICERIAQRVPAINREAAMLAGLIHDIGALPVMVWAEPIPNVIGNEASLRGLIDGLHADLGQAILQKWHYPEDLIAVPAEHEDLGRAPAGGADLADVVQIANLLSYRGSDDPRADFACWALGAARRLRLDASHESDLLEPARESANALAMVLSDVS